ncbi:hypothetical protein K7432_001316 [Basidiobolus ranarum]|uniref:Uncharacterized protein n=1 Tax=Basidiobolus ranarum TaxID=34480 RepID=A0ABR2W9U8_9FUNG
METWHFPLSHLKSGAETTSHQSFKQHNEVTYLSPTEFRGPRTHFSRGSALSTYDYANNEEYLAFEQSWDRTHTPFFEVNNSNKLLNSSTPFDNTLWVQDFIDQEIDSEPVCKSLEDLFEESEEFREEWSDEYFTKKANELRQQNACGSRMASYPESLNEAPLEYWDSLKYEGRTSRPAWSWEAVFANKIIRSIPPQSDQLIQTAHHRINLLVNHLIPAKAESHLLE